MSGGARVRPPLDLRLPNPPPLFVGRAPEIEALIALIERAPVTLVRGEGGIGKSALVSAALRGERWAREDDVLYVGLRPGAPPPELPVAAVRALVKVARIDGFDWSSVLADPREATAAAIDLAEDLRAVVCVDDAHVAPAETTVEALRLIARHARHSRWVVTTRAPLWCDELLGQELVLGALPQTEANELVTRLREAGAGEPREEALRDADGSPLRIRRAFSAPIHARATLRFLRALSSVASPIAPEIAARALPSPDEPLETLVASGLLERTEGGMRLHDVARDELLAEEAAAAADRVTIARSLVDHPGDDEALEGVRLLVSAGEHAEARLALARRGERLLAAGHAPSLARLLDELRDPSLVHLRLRCAAEMGDATPLTRLRLPGPEEPVLRLLWAGALVQTCSLDEGMELAREVAGSPAAREDPATAFEARCLLVRCLFNRGRFAEGLAEVAAIEPPNEVSAAMLDAIVAPALVRVSDPAALGRTDAARASLGRLPFPARARAAYLVAFAYVGLGRLDDADEVLEAAQGTRVELELGRRLRHLRLTIALERAHLRTCREALDDLAPFALDRSLARAHILQLRAACALASGDMPLAIDTLARLDVEPVLSHVRDDYLHAKLALAIATRQGAPAEAWLPGAAGDLGSAVPLIRLWAARLALRQGRLDPRGVLGEVAGGREPPPQAVLRLVARSEAAVVLGGFAEAASLALQAVELGTAHGLALLTLEAAAARCDGELAAGSAGLAGAVQALRAAAEAAGAGRHRGLADLFELLGGPALDWSALEDVAAGVDTAPEAAHRARALLGAASGADAVDRAVLGALLARRPDAQAVTLAFAGEGPEAAAGWKAGWGLCQARKAVWLPGGRWVELSGRKVSWELLVFLAERGGGATKEEIAIGVWGERSYHPLRHDNRLHTTVRKLRAQLEEDPARPEKLVTTAQGYALGGRVRRA